MSISACDLPYNTRLEVSTCGVTSADVSDVTSSPSGDDGDDEEGKEGGGAERMPSCADYIMHFVTVFWKVLFAFVPPTGEFPVFLSRASLLDPPPGPLLHGRLFYLTSRPPVSTLL